jgi:hypothetical protein
MALLQGQDVSALSLQHGKHLSSKAALPHFWLYEEHQDLQDTCVLRN